MTEASQNYKNFKNCSYQTRLLTLIHHIHYHYNYSFLIRNRMEKGLSNLY